MTMIVTKKCTKLIKISTTKPTLNRSKKYKNKSFKKGNNTILETTEERKEKN